MLLSLPRKDTRLLMHTTSVVNMLRPRLSLMTFLFLLYSSQGILYGLQSKFLPVALRTKGRSLIFIGSLNVVSLPWFVKSASAPLIDFYCSPTWWLRLTVTGIVTSLLFLHLSQHYTGVFAVMLFVLNVFSACQDVVLGKVLLGAITKLQPVNVGSSIQILAYKIGIVIGGGGMLLMSSSSTLISHYVFIIIAMLFLPLLLLFNDGHQSQPEVMSHDRNHGTKSETVSRVHHTNNHKVRHLNSLLDQFYHSISRGSIWLITCLLLYKYASHSCHMLFSMVLVDQGVTMETIGVTSGIAGHVLSAAVAIVIGIVLTNTRLTAFHIMYGVAIVDSLSAILQLCLVLTQDRISSQLVLLVFTVQHLVLGAQTTPVYSLILTYSQLQTNQGTQYSLFTTIETVGSKLSLFVTGLLAEYLGYTTSFVIAFIVSVIFAAIMKYPPRDYFTNSK